MRKGEDTSLCKSGEGMCELLFFAPRPRQTFSLKKNPDPLDRHHVKCESWLSTGCAALFKLSNLSKPVSSSVRWNYCSLLHRLVVRIR